MLGRFILLLVCSGFGASDAHAEGPAMLSIAPDSSQASQPWSLRVKQDSGADLRPSSFLASIDISSAATIGIGRFYVQPRRRGAMQDQPVSLEPKKARRAAVGLSLRF